MYLCVPHSFARAYEGLYYAARFFTGDHLKDQIRDSDTDHMSLVRFPLPPRHLPIRPFKTSGCLLARHATSR